MRNTKQAGLALMLSLPEYLRPNPSLAGGFTVISGITPLYFLPKPFEIHAF